MAYNHFPLTKRDFCENKLLRINFYKQPQLLHFAESNFHENTPNSQNSQKCLTQKFPPLLQEFKQFFFEKTKHCRPAL